VGKVSSQKGKDCFGNNSLVGTLDDRALIFIPCLSCQSSFVSAALFGSSDTTRGDIEP
jgi:hypothetical protein